MKTIEEKIDKAAKKYAELKLDLLDMYDNPTYYNGCIFGFIAGAKWMMQNQWVSVDEKLPGDGENCVIVDKYGLTRTAVYNAENKYWKMDLGGTAYYYKIRTVRYWTPILPLPEERKEEKK